MFPRLFPLLAALLLAGCASSGRRLPEYQKPLARAAVQQVRTTAYTHTESDHRQYARKSAVGSTLQSGAITSAAADWARWPVGTRFRVRETGQTYEVDDYGWALAGTNTIDLYQTSRAAMNRWGVRHVTIDVLQWGDPVRSQRILAPRTRHRHVQRMIKDLPRLHRRWPDPRAYPTAPVQYSVLSSPH